MATDKDKAARRKELKRRAKFSKKVQKKSDAPKLAAGAPRAYPLGKRKKEDELDPGTKGPSKTRQYVVGGYKPVSWEEKHKAKVPPKGHDTMIERFDVTDKGQERTELYEGKTKDIPKSIPGSSYEQGSSKDMSEKGYDLKTDARGSERDDPSYKELEARRKELGIGRDPDRLEKVKKKSVKGGGTKTRKVTKFFGKIPESEIEKAKERESKHQAEAKEGVRVKVRGKKIIEKRKTKERPTTEWDKATAESEENKAKARAIAANKAKERKKSKKKARKSFKSQ